MSEQSREAQSLLEELAKSRETIEALNAALDRNVGKMVVRGLLNSLLLAGVTGATVYTTVRLALRHADSH